MIAEGFATTGLALQIATELVPGQFVLLAGLGNLTKAVGKGMSKPCFRIIQTHFAQQNNVGSVAATEEVRCSSLQDSVVLEHALGKYFGTTFKSHSAPESFAET